MSEKLKKLFFFILNVSFQRNLFAYFKSVSYWWVQMCVTLISSQKTVRQQLPTLQRVNLHNSCNDTFRQSGSGFYPEQLSRVQQESISRAIRVKTERIKHVQDQQVSVVSSVSLLGTTFSCGWIRAWRSCRMMVAGSIFGTNQRRTEPPDLSRVHQKLLHINIFGHKSNKTIYRICFFMNVNEKLQAATGRGLSVSTSTDTNANNSTHSRKKRLAVNVSANRSESNIDICGKLVLLICFLADIHLSRWRWWCCQTADCSSSHTAGYF